MGKKLIIFLLTSQFIAPLLQPSENSMRYPENAASFIIPYFSAQVSPLWWEIKILLISTGEYKVKEEKTSYTGHYSLIIIWTGCMEIDEEDFLIYHENSELLRWEAKETSKSPELLKILSTDDFSGKPGFNFNYILRKGKKLHFDFKIDGFYIPQNDSEYKVYLELPASRENSKPASKINYNSFVFQGSNSIILEKKKIYLDTVEKTYTWKWKYRKWRSKKKTAASFSNYHNVKVTVTLMPHY